jgi:hypothetical protein
MISLQTICEIINNSKLSYETNNLITKWIKLLHRRWYIIEPDYKKSVCEKQYWYNSLLSGKEVTVLVNNVYRWGSFYIELNQEEKEEILESNEVDLDDYEHELIETWDGGCDFWVETLDEDLYTPEEKEEIENLIYKWQGKVPEYYDHDDEYYNEEKMELNGWFENDCKYIICTKCKLEESDGP